jgi:hypothetical protein
VSSGTFQKEHVCNLCGKIYMSNPALFLHVKIKHIQEEGRFPTKEGKRPKGRPRKNVS